MLHAITLESLRAAVVHVHRKRDRDGALREHEPIAIVGIDFQIIGDDLELVASHLEYFVVVNTHRSKRGKLEYPAGNAVAICAATTRAVKSKVRCPRVRELHPSSAIDNVRCQTEFRMRIETLAVHAGQDDRSHDRRGHSADSSFHHV